MYIYSRPDQVDVLKGTFIPWCDNCTRDALDQGLGLIGAVIMPHNIYLHSGLVLSRTISRHDPSEVREGIKYNTIESTIALFVSFVINLFVICVFGASVYAYDYDACSNLGLLTADKCLYEAFGQQVWIKYIWAIGLLASGQSSTMTGTYAGQFVMEGFLGLKWAKWKRVLLTRSIAMVPCVIIGAVAANKLDILDDYINVEQSLLLPFSVLPVLFATTSKRIMKEHRSNIVLTVIAWIIAVVVMGVNCSFVIESIVSGAPVYAIVLASVGLLLYFSIIAFFIIFPIIKEIKYWRMTRKSSEYEQIN
jgi:natural resistance-associated macrophage protein